MTKIIENENYFEKVFNSNYKLIIEGEKVSFEILNLEKLYILSGKIIAGDLYTSEDIEPFTEIFPIGNFDVELSLAKFSDDTRVAFARIKFSDELPVSWKMALTEGQNENEKDNSGYWVDSASAGFIDSECYEELLNNDEYQMDIIDEELEKSYKSTYRYFMWKDREFNGAFYSTGFGDGHYYTFIGYDKNNNICRLVTDFDLFS